MKIAQENSVRSLQGLYTVIVGLALSEAAMRTLDDRAGQEPVHWALLPYFLTFAVILVPFYHGAIRHLDATYLEAGAKPPRSGALMADFALLFVEGMVFLSLAALIAKPEYFAWLLVILLTLDSVWGFAAHLAFSRDSGEKPETRWALINLSATVLLVLYLVLADAFPPTAAGPDAKLSIGVPAIAILRTVFDYAFCWGSYFPTESAPLPEEAAIT